MHSDDTIRAALELEAAHQSRRDELEARAVPGDPLAPYRRPDGTLDVDALELGHPAPILTRLEGPSPFTTIRNGRRYVPATVRDARRRAQEAAERNPPPVPGVDVDRLRAVLEERAAPAPARGAAWTVLDWTLTAGALAAVTAAGAALAALA